ncbi:MAG: MFS transporter [Actinomycetota bacterium]|nr:MFS transporter [Actinomycetota bacterium]
MIIAAISLAGVLANALVAPALPDIARALSVDDTGIGLVVAAASLPGVVVAPIIGVAADRFGRRIVVVPCLVVFGLGGMAAMVAPNFGVLIAARLLQGLGAAGLVNLAVVMIGDRHEGAVERAAAIGRNGAVLIVGLAVFPVVGGGLVAVAGWRAAFAPMALTLGVAVAAARLLPRERPAAVVSLTAQVRAAGSSLADRRVVAMLVVGFWAFVLVFGVVLTVLPIDLDQRFGAGPALRGVILGLPAVASVVVALTMGRLSSRFGTWNLVLAGFIVLAATFTGVALAGTVALVGVAMVVYGVGETLVIVPLQAFAAGLAPAHRGVMVAVWVSAVRAGQAAGPVLAGFCLGALSSRGTIALGSAVSVVMAGAVLMIRRAVSLR